MAKELWNASLTSSNVKVLLQNSHYFFFLSVDVEVKTHGSPEADVHIMVTVPPEVGFWGIWRVSPATRGVTRARRLHD
jgi:hypothetical protein